MKHIELGSFLIELPNTELKGRNRQPLRGIEINQDIEKIQQGNDVQRCALSMLYIA